MTEKAVIKIKVLFDESLPVGEVRTDDFQRIVWIHPDAASDVEAVKDAAIAMKHRRDN